MEHDTIWYMQQILLSPTAVFTSRLAVSRRLGCERSQSRERRRRAALAAARSPTLVTRTVQLRRPSSGPHRHPPPTTPTLEGFCGRGTPSFAINCPQHNGLRSCEAGYNFGAKEERIMCDCLQCHPFNRYKDNKISMLSQLHYIYQTNPSADVI